MADDFAKGICAKCGKEVTPENHGVSNSATGKCLCSKCLNDIVDKYIG